MQTLLYPRIVVPKLTVPVKRQCLLFAGPLKLHSHQLAPVLFPASNTWGFANSWMKIRNVFSYFAWLIPIAIREGRLLH